MSRNVVLAYWTLALQPSVTWDPPDWPVQREIAMGREVARIGKAIPCKAYANPVARDLRAVVNSPNVRSLLGLCLFEIAYYFAYRYGMSFSQESASPFWFPDSVLLCALLLSAPGKWWIFVLAALPIRLFVSVPSDVPQWFLLATFAIDSAKGVFGAAILRRLIRESGASRNCSGIRGLLFVRGLADSVCFRFG